MLTSGSQTLLRVPYPMSYSSAKSFIYSDRDVFPPSSPLKTAKRSWFFRVTYISIELKNIIATFPSGAITLDNYHINLKYLVSSSYTSCKQDLPVADLQTQMHIPEPN